MEYVKSDCKELRTRLFPRTNYCPFRAGSQVGASRGGCCEGYLGSSLYLPRLPGYSRDEAAQSPAPGKPGQLPQAQVPSQLRQRHRAQSPSSSRGYEQRQWGCSNQDPDAGVRTRCGRLPEEILVQRLELGTLVTRTLRRSLGGSRRPVRLPGLRGDIVHQLPARVLRWKRDTRTLNRTRSLRGLLSNRKSPSSPRKERKPASLFMIGRCSCQSSDERAHLLSSN